MTSLVVHGWQRILSVIFLYLTCAYCSKLTDDSGADLDCSWRNKVDANTPEIFWINMDRSVPRRRSMEAHLNAFGLPHRRVKGLSFEDILIPSDVAIGWDTARAKTHTVERVRPRNQSAALLLPGSNASHVLVGLFGRPKTNRLKEVGCTASHLEAIRQAIHENRSSSPYAVIAEDDIFFPFNVDFERLIATAPEDFSVLQIFNSNGDSMRHNFDRYRKHGELWIENKPRPFLAFWSTCAYVIHRERLRPLIDSIIYRDPVDAGRFHMKMIAAVNSPCRPLGSDCCQHSPHSRHHVFTAAPECVLASKGFQADSFIYALNKTYVLNVPLVINGAGGNLSTFHQDHVEMLHHAAFQRLRGYANDLTLQRVSLPHFASPACPRGVPVQMQLTKSEICHFQDTTKQKDAPLLVWLVFTDRLQALSAMQHTLAHSVPYANVRVFGLREHELFMPRDVRSAWDSSSPCTGRSALLALDDVVQQDQLVQRGLRGAVVGACVPNHAKNETSSDKSLALSAERDEWWMHWPQGARSLSHSLSHLWAIYTARSRRGSSSPPYALIVEDDVQFVIDIDIDQLVKSAPPDWVFLRLFVSEKQELSQLWERYARNQSDLFSQYMNTGKGQGELYAKAYVVHLDRVWPVLQKLVPEVHWYRRGEQLFPMFDLRCCENISSNECVACANGHGPDSLLWSLGTTYTLNVPVLSSAFNDQRAFGAAWKTDVLNERVNNQRHTLKRLLTGEAPLPSFVRSSCQLRLN